MTMEPTEHNLARVAVDIPRDQLPELMELLGGLAAQGTDLQVCISDTPPQPHEARLPYNRGMCDEIRHPDTGVLTSVITRHNLQDFQRDVFNGKTNLGSHIASKLFDKELDSTTEPARSSLIITSDGTVLGIDPEQADALLARATGLPRYQQIIGAKSRDMFEDYCEALYRLDDQSVE